MTSPLGQEDTNPPQKDTQQLPSEPQQSPIPKETAPTKSSSTKKPRQKKQAETKSRQPAATASQPSRTSEPVSQQPPQERQVQQYPPAVVVHRGPALQPYPGPTYHIMNPPYPLSGSPYVQQQSHPGYPSHSPPPSSNGSSGPGIPGPPPQYAYPMHPAPYAHGYAAYPQYPQQMIVYPQRPNPPPQGNTQSAASTASPATPPAPPSTGKRKRKSDAGRGKGDKEDDEVGASGSDLGRSNTQSQAQSTADMKKRTKTQRACDSCRSRKIRCDVLPDAEPPVCQHCKQYGFECTFFLPITETRFKKKKVDDDSADKSKPEPTRTASTSSPNTETHPKSDAIIIGPTSVTHLLHSQSSVSSRIYEQYDLRYHHTWEVSTTGDGLIQVLKPEGEDQPMALPKPLDLRIERDIIENLVNGYFQDVAPILPVITREEFLSNSTQPPILLYSMCLIAASRREVPQNVFDSLRYAVNSVLKADDVLSTASIVNVQSLLILCMMADCHSQFVPNALSALWLRLGTAIRMAQDLGVHRAEQFSSGVELRRRLWSVCVILDRLTSLTYGHPHMIDVRDCDARLPSSGDSSDLYLDELVRLSVISGRVLQTIYGPSGLKHATDEDLQDLLNDLESWKSKLPEQLKFKGPNTPRGGGLLHMLYSCVMMLFWRVFMRISYTCPAHLKFTLKVSQWTALGELTGETIEWLEANEKVYDVWLVVSYCATSCALVQYHSFVRRNDMSAVPLLRKLRDTVRRWEENISPDHMSARRKTAEIICLLFEATQGPPIPLDTPPLNPTGGVVQKQPSGGLNFVKDPSRPGGGVFVASKESKNHKELAEGDVISSEENDAEQESGAGTAATAKSSDRSTLLQSSSFAPPLPASESLSPQLRRGLMARAGMVQGEGSNGATSTGLGNPSAPMVNFTPLGGHAGNVNPVMDSSTMGSESVMSTMGNGGGLSHFDLGTPGFMEALPGGLLDFGQWDSFFSRLGNGDGGMAAFQQQLQQNHASMSHVQQDGQSRPQHYR